MVGIQQRNDRDRPRVPNDLPRIGVPPPGSDCETSSTRKRLVTRSVFGGIGTRELIGVGDPRQDCRFKTALLRYVRTFPSPSLPGSPNCEQTGIPNAKQRQLEHKPGKLGWCAVARACAVLVVRGLHDVSQVRRSPPSQVTNWCGPPRESLAFCSSVCCCMNVGISSPRCSSVVTASRL